MICKDKKIKMNNNPTSGYLSHHRVTEMIEQLSNSLQAALTSLSNVWNEIGIDQSQRRDRTEVVMIHLRNLLNEMVTEERGMADRLLANIQNHKDAVATLRQELALNNFVSTSGLTLIQLEKELRLEAERLGKEKGERMKRLKRLKDHDQHLCDVLVTTPYYVPSGTVPSNEQLDELEKHIQNLESEKDHRHGILLTTRKDIANILDELGQEPNTTFERDLVCEEEDSFLLSTENMNAMKMYHQELEVKQQENKQLAEELRLRMVTLWDRLELTQEEQARMEERCEGYKDGAIEEMRCEIERCEALKLQNMKRFVEGVRKELISWWDKCYFSERQRQEFYHYKRDDYCEDLLEAHELEVSAMKQYYEKNKEMLERVSRREELWNKMVEFDIRAKDVNRFSNRGGNLLQEEKARKKVLKDLPKVEQKLKEDILEWETKQGREFLVKGQRFMDYIEQQWAEYHSQKENEKNQRHKRKEIEMEQEMIYGSKPTTPAKRRFIGTTPSKTPTNKIRKLNDTKTPSSMSRLATPRSAASVSRMGMSKVFSSPALVPRERPPRPNTIQKTRGIHQKTPQRSLRRALGDRNDGDVTAYSSASGGSSVSSIVPPVNYQDFANGINQSSRPNCRSSMMPERVNLQF